MTQHDYVIDNQSFPATRTDLNNVLQAIVSNNSGTSAPSTTFANQIWYDSNANILYIRNEDNDANIPLMQFDQSADVASTLATVIDILDASGTNQAGTALTIRGGAGTGTGTGGSIILQTADGGSSGSSVNSHATAIEIKDDGTVEVSGDLSITDKIIHTGDTNTAIRFPATDTVTVETAGSERVRVDSSGRVGIGESSPDRALDVVGSGVVAEINSSNSNALKLEFSDNGTTRSFLGASSSNAFQVSNSSGTNLFNVTSAGLLGIPNLPAFHATGSGTLSFSGTAAFQEVVLTSERIDNGADYNTSTGKFTCPVAGIYLFHASITTTAAATGVEAFIENETQSSTAIARVISYGDAFDTGTLFGIDDCAASDVIRVRAINNNNTSFDIDLSRCSFAGFLLGAT